MEGLYICNYCVYVVQLWSYIYSDGSNIISGYTLNQMIWYVITTELIWFSTRSGFIRNEISNDVKSGKIAYTLNKPYHYAFYVLAKYLGECVVSYSVNAVVAIALGMVYVGNLQTFHILSLPFILITIGLATVISALYI